MAGETFVRFQMPRELTHKEDFVSLSKWETKVRTFYARDVLFSKYYNNGGLHRWNRAAANCGFTTTGANTPQEVTAEQKKGTLDLFINNLLGLMPNMFLKDAFHSSANLEGIFNVIRASYSVEVTSRSQLDLCKMSLQVGENYQSFYDRLVSHATEHLARGGTPAQRGFAVPAQGDAMSVSHLDSSLNKPLCELLHLHVISLYFREKCI